VLKEQVPDNVEEERLQVDKEPVPSEESVLEYRVFHDYLPMRLIGSCFWFHFFCIGSADFAIGFIVSCIAIHGSSMAIAMDMPKAMATGMRFIGSRFWFHCFCIGSADFASGFIVSCTGRSAMASAMAILGSAMAVAMDMPKAMATGMALSIAMARRR